MSLRSLGFAGLLAVALVAACGSREPADTRRAGGPGAPSVVSGFAVHGHEVKSFRPCGTEEPLWAVDRSRVLWEVYEELAFHNQPYEEIFCIVEGTLEPAPEDGFGAGYAGAIEVTKVFYMAQEGFRCNLDLTRFFYRAYGNEPFWSVWISAGGITLAMPGREDGTWVEVETQQQGTGPLYLASGPSGSIAISIVEEPCRDTMSGAYFSLSAAVVLGDIELRGCALKGTATR